MKQTIVSEVQLAWHVETLKAALVPLPFHVSYLILMPKHLLNSAGGKTQVRP